MNYISHEQFIINGLIFINVVFLLYCGYTDIKKRIIKNKVVVIIFFVSLLIGFISNKSIVILYPLIILFTGFIMTIMQLIGAGDIKLITALSFAMTNQQISNFLLLIAFSGIPLVIVILLLRVIKQKRLTVPYGIAICAGYFLLLISE